MKILRGILFFAFVLISCSGDLNETILEKDQKFIHAQNYSVKLNFVGHWLYQGKREILVREMANEFEFLNQECSVNLEFPEDIYYSRSRPDSEEEFVSKQLLSKNPTFDILRINDQYLRIAFYMNDMDWPKKYLVDFSQYPEFMENTLPDLVSEKAKEKWKGIIPGPYLEGYNYALWYNQELAKKIGLEIKQTGMTFDDLLTYVKKIDEYNKTHNTDIIPLHECSDWSTINILYLRLFISQIDNWEECLKDYYNQNKLDAYYKTLKAFEQLSNYNAYSKKWKEYPFMNSLDFPLKHKCFFYTNASWMYNYWQNIDDNEANYMVPAELPVFKPSKVYFGGYSIMWAVPKNAPNKEMAVKFLLNMTKPDIAEKWSRYTKCPSGIKGNVTSVSFGKDQFEDFTYFIDQKYGLKKLSFNYLDNGIVLGISKRNINLRTIEVATGVMTADEAMADIRNQLKNFE